MYFCVHVCICMHVCGGDHLGHLYVHVYVCICVYVHVCMCVEGTTWDIYMYVYVFICVYVCTCMCVWRGLPWTFICMCICMHMCVCVCTCVHVWGGDHLGELFLSSHLVGFMVPVHQLGSELLTTDLSHYYGLCELRLYKPLSTRPRDLSVDPFSSLFSVWILLMGYIIRGIQ